MFKKIASKFAKSELSKSLTPVELDAQASIATSTACNQLREKLEVALKLNIGNFERIQLIRSQIEEVKLAIIHHAVNDERARVEATFKRDSLTCAAAKSQAQESHCAATEKLQEANAKHQVIIDRLTPLQDELARSRVAAKEAAKTAQANFDAAIAAGDTSAETIASERLYQALKATDVGGTSGPLTLRIAALQRELDATVQAVIAAKDFLAAADKAIAYAEADFALLDYDRQVQNLLDAWVIQKAAVLSTMKHDQARKKFMSTTGAFAVDLFELQISSHERILFGLKMDVYNRRHLPIWICDQLVKAAMGTPNLEILAAKVEDLPVAISTDTPEDIPMMHASEVD